MKKKNNAGKKILICKPVHPGSCWMVASGWHLSHGSSAALTLALQQGPGLEVELRGVRFGRRWAQGVGGERERVGGRLGLTEGLRAVHHLLPLRLCDGLGGWMGQLLCCGMRRLLRSRLGHGSRALQHKQERWGSQWWKVYSSTVLQYNYLSISIFCYIILLFHYNLEKILYFLLHYIYWGAIVTL